jgi:hypothetical protein
LSNSSTSLNLERTYETGVLDTAANVERLSEYPDYEEDARCAGSHCLVTRDEGIRESRSGLLVRCKTCGTKVYAYWRRGSQTWALATHYASPLENEGPVALTEPSKTSG